MTETHSAVLRAARLAIRALIPLNWLYGVAVLLLLAATVVAESCAILRRLLAIVETVSGGDPFVAANAERLRIIAWSLCALQVLGMIVVAIGKAVADSGLPLHLGAGFSASGWLAVLMAFVLAQVFAVGTELRDEVRGTV